MRRKTVGKLIAVMLFIAVGSAVTIGFLRGGAVKPAAVNRSMDDEDLPSPPESSRTVADPRQGGSVQDLVAMADEGIWTRIDRLTGRVEAKITWTRLEPLAAGRFEITQPRGFIYQTDRTIEIDADRGTVIWPSREREPESGELSGDVILRAIDLPKDSALSSPPPPPALTLRTPDLSFISALSEVSAPGPVAVEGSGITGRIEGLLMRFARAGALPIGLFRIERGGMLTYDPSRAAGSGDDPGAADAAEASDPSPESSAEQFYELTIGGPVHAAGQGRSIDAASGRIFSRFVGGSLKPGAVAPFDTFETLDTADSPRAPSQPADVPPTGEGPIEIAFQGAVEFKPLTEAPAELSKDDVFIELLGGAGLVTAGDPSSGQRTSAKRLTYAATTRRLSWDGAADAPMELAAVDAGRMASLAARIDLTSGEGAFDGPGIIEAAASMARAGSQAPPRISYAERGELILDVSRGPVGSTPEVPLKEVKLFGNVVGTDGRAELRGEGVRALFEASPGGEEPSLARLMVRGGGSARDAESGMIEARDLDVEFKPDPSTGDPIPAFASARGAVRASKGEESLAAELLDATLELDDAGEVRIARIEARESVLAKLIRESGAAGAPMMIDVSADTLTADTRTGIIELVGTPVSIDRSAADGSGFIRGGSMRIESSADARRITVFGSGAAAYTMPGRTPAESGEGTGADRADLSFTDSFIYDDVKGSAEALGRAVAKLARGSNELHETRGERILVNLTPAPSGAPAPETRELLGALVEGGDDRPAELELRRFAASAAAGGERILEGLAFLRGPSIAFDAVASRLTVVGPGLWLLEDRRPSDAEPPGADPLTSGDLRGTSVIEWTGDMVLDRTAGTAEVRGGIRIRHKDPISGRIADMSCDGLSATVDDPGFRGAATGASLGTEAMTLKTIEARGAIQARYMKLDLRGEGLTYDAAAGTIVVNGTEERPALLYDGDKGTSGTAERFVVELATGNWRAEKAGTVTVPR